MAETVSICASVHIRGHIGRDAFVSINAPLIITVVCENTTNGNGKLNAFKMPKLTQFISDTVSVFITSSSFATFFLCVCYNKDKQHNNNKINFNNIFWSCNRLLLTKPTIRWPLHATSNIINISFIASIFFIILPAAQLAICILFERKKHFNFFVFYSFFFRSIMAECLASFLYVFVVCGAAAGAGVGASISSVVLATALSSGFVVTTLTQCFSHISGRNWILNKLRKKCVFFCCIEKTGKMQFRVVPDPILLCSTCANGVFFRTKESIGFKR